MKTYSVEIEQTEYADDMFVGTFEECVDYIKKEGYNREDNDVRIAEIELDEKGCVDYTYHIITEW